MQDQGNNSGQFGQREDTEEQARKGGEASGGNMSNLKNVGNSGKKTGGTAISKEEARRGGKNSRRGR